MNDKSGVISTLTAFILAFATMLSISGCITGNGKLIKPTHPIAAVSDKTETTIQEQLSNKTWLLAGYRTGEYFVPLVPGQGSTAWILFFENGTMQGTTGINTFSGAWSMKKTSKAGIYTISIDIKGLTKIAAPNETAAKFELDLIQQIEAASLLQTGKDSILLMNEQNETLVQCVYREAGLVF